jgi:Ca2+-binding EF-hand superfamily protein
LGNSVNEEQYSNLLKEFDKNNDGEISRFEFRDMMRSLVKKTSVTNGSKSSVNATSKTATGTLNRSSSVVKNIVRSNVPSSSTQIKRNSLLKSNKK